MVGIGRSVELIGAAAGLGAPDARVALGPAFLQAAGLGERLGARWTPLLAPRFAAPRAAAVADFNRRLARRTAASVAKGAFPLVLGGDHSVAAGTWRGVAGALDGSLGLLWIDAHMDAHTVSSSPSGNWHGMPLASLLGADGSPGALRPEHVALVGVRSYEPEEAALLARLGVRVFFIDEVQRRGPAAVFEEALGIVARGTARFGVTVDLDALDPADAPGTGLPVADGLRSGDLVPALAAIGTDRRLVAAEIVEYNPFRDEAGVTARLVESIAGALARPVVAPVA